MENIIFYHYKGKSIFFTYTLPLRCIFVVVPIIFAVHLLAFIRDISFYVNEINDISLYDFAFSLLSLVFLIVGISVAIYGYMQVKPVGINGFYLHHGFTKTRWKKVVSVEERTTKGGKKTLVIKTARHNLFYKRIIVNSLISNYEDLKKKINSFTASS